MFTLLGRKSARRTLGESHRHRSFGRSPVVPGGDPTTRRPHRCLRTGLANQCPARARSRGRAVPDLPFHCTLVARFCGFAWAAHCGQMADLGYHRRGIDPSQSPHCLPGAVETASKRARPQRRVRVRRSPRVRLQHAAMHERSASTEFLVK